MIHRIAVATGLTAVSLFIFCGQATAATEVQDAACLGSSGVYHQPTNGSRVAETFTALHTGAVTRAQFSVYKDSATTGDYVLDLRTLAGSSVPTDTVLASTTVLNASVPDGQSLISNTFSAPPSVVAGQRYALGVSRPGGSQIAIEVLSNPCSDNQLFTSPGSGLPWTMPNGGSWDARFAVFVTPPSPTSPTTTGQRAAALKKCKKKDSARKRRKCRRKARLLPV
jgi:hypothetical protein